MFYRVEFSRQAQRELRKAPRQDQERLRTAIDALAHEPRPHGSLKLEGEERTYRIRVGPYRVLYDIYDDVLLIEIMRAGQRQSVYRR